MNQVTLMFMQSNERMKQIIKGETKLDIIAAAQREFEGQIKLLNSIISIYGIASKNKRAISGFKQMNILDDTAAIDLELGDVENEKVKCKWKDRLITRQECLDFSGSNPDDCKGCEVGMETRDLLLNERRKND